MSRLQKGVNDLLTWCKNNGEQGERLIQEWTGITEQAEKEYLEQLKELEVSNHEFDDIMDNSKPEIKRISMEEMAKGSHTRVKWKCRDCNYEWVTTINSRTSVKSNCPACAGKAIIPGINDLHTWCLQAGEQGQRLIQEWVGLDENENPISMDSVTKGSHRKVKWKCSKCNHEWLSDINQRTQGYNCPACGIISGAEKKSTPIQGINDLHTWCLQAGEQGQRLIQEWVGLDENENPISMDSVTKGSHRKVKWKCSKCNHEWLSDINQRTQGYNCPACGIISVAEKRSTPTQGINDLYSWCLQNREQGERLISEWAGLDENENPISIDSVAKASNKKVKWKCKDCNHEWFARIADRTNVKSNCPACANQVVIPGKNDLYTWCLQNGERGKRLISEWTGLDEDNNIVCIDSVTRASGKKVQWKCKRGHEWFATINSRTNAKSNCPACNPKSTSYPEQILYHYFKQIFPNTISRGTFNNYEYDITIPELKTCIEYSGYYYHQDKLDRDAEKYHLCKKHGVHFIQIYCHQGELFNSEDLTNILHTFDYTEDDLDESGDLFTPNLIIYQQSLDHDNQIKDILSFLLNQFNHSIAEIDFNKATEDAMKFIEDTIDNECESE